VPIQSEARVSPDGKKIAYTAATPDAEVWTYDLESKSTRQLTTGGGNVWPTWSEDSTRVAYGSFRHGSLATFAREVSGGDESEVQHFGAPQQWLADGSMVLQAPRDGRNLWLLQPGAVTTTPLPGAQPRDLSPKMTTDRALVAVYTVDSGRPEAVVYPYAGGERIQVSGDGGIEPVWSRDGRTLFYRRGFDMMMVERLSESPLRFSAPRKLFSSANFAGGGNRANFDVMPDGQHFLMVLLDRPRPTLRLTATLNWSQTIAAKMSR